MVQGHSKITTGNSSAIIAENKRESKKIGFENLQKRDNEKRLNDERTKSSGSLKQYGSWGPIFKNEKNFKSMHHC